MSDELELSPDDKIIQRAKDRFKAVADWESDARKHYEDDLKFAEGDAINGWQWPNDLRRSRETAARPTLTINKTRQHNLQIINDAKQNKPGIALRAVSGRATFQSAQVMEGLVRHIEYQSNASNAYDTATEFQVKGGIGYWRVTTKYFNDDTFDQDIYIEPINNPLSVYIDPDIKQKDGSDAKWGFIFDEIPKKQFEKKYPKFKDMVNTTPLQNAAGDWIKPEHVRVAEYFELDEQRDTLISFIDTEKGTRQVVRVSQIGEKLAKQLLAMEDTVKRETIKKQWTWYMIVGDKIADRKPWAGKYLPIVRVIGEETVIDNKLDRKGHTRAMIDPQRMYNYWTSSAVEHVALQGKTPWVASAQAIEGFEVYWNTANTNNYSVLPYNSWDDDGQQQIPAPQRAQPPQMAQAYIQGMQLSSQELMDVSGQHQAQMGAPSNERSGKAINERQRQSDNSTYHFVDNLAIAIRYTGIIIIDLIPKIYDTERVVKILAENGDDIEVKIDPNAQQAYMIKQAERGQAIERVLNPSVGIYEVHADIGPAYSTQRQEAFNAISQILTTAPNLTALIGDILFKVADFPLADEISDRLKRAVPQHVLGVGPSPEVQQAQAVISNLQKLLADTMEELSIEKVRGKARDQLRITDAYDSETKRLDVVGRIMKDLGEGPVQRAEIEKIVRQLTSQMSGTTLEPVIKASEAGLQDDVPNQLQLGLDGGAPPVPGARQAQDGKWYLPDPQRPGKWLQVM